jgi:IMP dehydrogenase
MREQQLAVDDVLLVPGLGRLSSRSDAVMHPFIYSAPMDTVTDPFFAQALMRVGHIPCLPTTTPTKDLESLVDATHLCNELKYDETLVVAVPRREKISNDMRNLLKRQSAKSIIVAVDVAHGHSIYGLDTIKYLSDNFNLKGIMSGSIVTDEAAEDCIESGATLLRVGVGPGAACSTRVQTGFGYPQLGAVYTIAQAIKNLNKIQIIADGGIRNPGDAAKYLAFGAHGIMMGSVFSKAKESPGWRIDQDGTSLVKTYRGQASASYQESRFGKANDCPEGVTSKEFKWDGLTTVEKIVKEFEGGIRSAISYSGHTSLKDFCELGVAYVRITDAGRLEGLPKV